MEWGLAIESAPADKLDERFEILLERIARVPINQLVMMKLLVNQSTREYRYVRARTIAEAEREGIVVILVGPAE